MTSLGAAMKKAAENDPEFMKIINDAERHTREERRRISRVRARQEKEKKLAAMKAEQEKKDQQSKINRSKDIYIWRTNVCGMGYSMNCGFVFADSLDEAKEVVSKTINGDLIFVEKADTSCQVIETGMYIE